MLETPISAWKKAVKMKLSSCSLHLLPLLFLLSCSSDGSTAGGIGGDADATGVDGEIECQRSPVSCPISPPLRAEDGLILDHHGRRVLLRGLNVSESWKPLTTPFGDHTEEDFRQWRAYGFNVLRMLTSWGHLMPQEDHIDEEYLAGLKQRAQWAQDNGLLIILDMHQDLYGYGFTVDEHSLGNGAPEWSCPAEEYAKLTDPRTPWPMNHLNEGMIACFDYFWDHEQRQEQYSAAFHRAIEELQGIDSLIGVDLFNEPSWGSFDRMLTYEEESLMPLYRRMIASIRATRPELIHFLEPGAVKNIVGETHLPAPDYENIVYTPHFYDSNVEVGADYNPQDPYFHQQIAADLAQAETFGAPLMLGEWGVPNALGASKAGFLRDLTELFDRHLASWTMWESGPSYDATGFYPPYGILNDDRTVNSWVRDLSRPFPTAWPDRDLEFTYDASQAVLTITSERRLPDAQPIGEIVIPSWSSSIRIEQAEGVLETNQTSDRLFVLLADEQPVELRIEFHSRQ